MGDNETLRDDPIDGWKTRARWHTRSDDLTTTPRLQPHLRKEDIPSLFSGFVTVKYYLRQLSVVPIDSTEGAMRRHQILR